METNFSSQALIKLLHEIITKIQRQDLDLEIQEKLWEHLTQNPDKELVKYLFTGWWIHQNFPHDKLSS